MGLSSDFTLTPDEVRALETLRRRARESRDIPLLKRTRAILLLGREGKLRRDVAEICETSLRSVFLWQKDYRVNGLEGLKTGLHTGRPQRLSSAQLDLLARLVEHGPEAAGYDTGRWTAAVLADEIYTRFSVRYSTSQVRRILHQLGFSVQYPKKSWQRQTK